MGFLSDVMFARHFRYYQYSRLKIEYREFDWGFIGFKIDNGVLFITDLFNAPGGSFFDLVRELNKLCKEAKAKGCTHLAGGNDTTLPTYKKIKKLHTWYGMSYHENNGTLEIWVKKL